MIKRLTVKIYRMQIYLTHPDMGVTVWQWGDSPMSNHGVTQSFKLNPVALHKKEEKRLRQRSHLTRREMEQILHSDAPNRDIISWHISPEVRKKMKIPMTKPMPKSSLDQRELH